MYVLFCISSLMKDMTGRDDQFRGPAIRALCSITDVSACIPFLSDICEHKCP